MSKFVRLAALGIAVGIFSGCGTMMMRTVTRPKWNIQTGENDNIIVRGANREVLLTIKKQGSKWYWTGSPEDVVTALLEYSITSLARETTQLMACREQLVAANKKINDSKK